MSKENNELEMANYAIKPSPNAIGGVYMNNLHSDDVELHGQIPAHAFDGK